MANALTKIKAGAIGADAIDSSDFAAASIDNEHLADNAVGLAEMAGLARGKIIYGDSSGDPAALAVGSNGTYLKSDGTDISWASVSAGTTLSGSTDNQLTTVTGANAIQGEANLTFDGSTLGIVGTITKGNGIIDIYDSNTDTVITNGVTNGDIVLNAVVSGQGTVPVLRLGNGDASGAVLIPNDFGKLKLGASQDLEIFHDGSNSYIKEVGTGDLLVTTNGGAIQLQKGDTEVLANFGIDGACNLYYDNAKKLETTSAGVTITGDLTVTGNAPGGISSDAQDNTVAGTNAGDAFSGTDALGNTFFGKNAGTSVTTGDYNHGYGADTLASCQTGSNNIAIGKSALYNATLSNNVCVGYYSGNALTTGQNNTAIGGGSMQSNQTGSNNTVIGYSAFASGTGGNNVVIGYGSGNAAGAFSQNVFIGLFTGDACTSGPNNTAIGYNAGSAFSTEGSNTYLGASCGLSATGPGNTAIGAAAFSTGNTGSNNVIIGNLAGQYKTGASLANTVVGAYAYRGGDESEGNTCLGYGTGSVISTGDNNVCIGRSAGSYITTGADNIFIGHGTGMLGSPTGVHSTGSNVLSLGSNVISDFYCADTSISSSDKRDKTDITEWTHGLDWINKLKPVTYRWDKRAFYSDDYSVTPDGSKKWQRQHLGFLAQDVLEVEQSFGYAGKKDDMLTVNLNCDDTAYGMKYERLVVVLTKAVQELSSKNDALEARITVLEAA